MPAQSIPGPQKYEGLFDALHSLLVYNDIIAVCMEHGSTFIPSLIAP